jgi:hypothetical protein
MTQIVSLGTAGRSIVDDAMKIFFAFEGEITESEYNFHIESVVSAHLLSRF